MKVIINTCYGGFAVRDEILEKLGLKNMDEKELRYNSELISLIEAGEKVSATYSDLKVIELPDNCTDYHIDEYDGLEDIVYVVDGKLHWM